MGALITIEGGEYVGKTSVAIPGLRDCFVEVGIPIQTSREPGGTPDGEAIRAELFEMHENGADPIELAQLFMRARAVHLDQVILPFLGTNKQRPAVMILDRYLDSTRLYQGLEAGIPLRTIHQLEQEYLGSYLPLFLPDATALLTIPEPTFEQVMRARQHQSHAHSERDTNAWDTSSLQTHRTRQQRYHQLPRISDEWGEERCFATIDASVHPFQVIEQLCRFAGSVIENKQLLPSNLTTNLTDRLCTAQRTLSTVESWSHLDQAWQDQHRLLDEGVIQ